MQRLPPCLDKAKPFNIGTVPLEGTDPTVYAPTSAVCQLYSYFSTSPSGRISPQYIPYLPVCPVPTYLSLAEMYERIKAENSLDGWEKADDGTLKFVDKVLMEKQKGIIIGIFAKAIKSLVYSNLVGLSIPARIFDCISALESMALGARYTPTYLSRAARLSDRLERFKLFVVWAIAQLKLNIKKASPLNPTIGETLQAGLDDGTLLYFEQTSHHPPITSCFYEGPQGSYKVFGHIQVDGKMSLNSMSFYSLSKMTAVFKDGQTLETNAFPTMKLAGLTMGDRKMMYKNCMTCIDRKSKLKAVIFFDYGEKKGIFTSAKTCIEELNDIKTEIARVKGSWLDKVEINGVNYWAADRVKLSEFIYQNNPLPSDSRFREDLIWLRRNKIDYADKWKDAIEIRQRHDNTERQKYAH